ncbi:hypothetical protein [Xenorhabdus entomophaga]|uniref:hypothetical protein n=1 Tax=Xenorhabdus entomophaga TaxID=3136257 RepID=UPI0030F4917B
MKYTFSADKAGTKTWFTIPNGAPLKEKMPSRALCRIDDDGTLHVTCTNKREAQDVELAISIANRPLKNNLEQDVEQTQNTKTPPRRYVASLFMAQLKNLNHGKPWVCTEYDIQLKGASPAWEGELICYVYEEKEKS